MVSVDLSTFVDLEGGTHSIDSNGHLITEGEGIAFPSIVLQDGKTYRFTIGYDSGGADKIPYYDVYSMLSPDEAGYNDSNMYTLANIYASRTSKNTSSTGPGVGTFTMFLGPGIGDYGLAMTANSQYEGQLIERYLLWYFWTTAPTFKVTSIRYEEIVLERGDWEPQAADFGYTEAAQDIFQYDAQPWSSKNWISERRYSGAGNDPIPISREEVYAAMDQVNNWPPTSPVEYHYSPPGGNLGAYWGLGLDGSLGDSWITYFDVYHEFAPRGINFSANFYVPPQSQWPEGAIGYEWNDPSQIGGQGARATPVSLKLRPAETVMGRSNADTTPSSPNPDLYPAFTTHIMAAPVVFDPPWGRIVPTVPTNLTEVATYNFPGEPGPIQGNTELLSTRVGNAEIELLPYAHITEDGAAQLLLLTITDPVMPAEAPHASLFGADDIVVGARLNTAIVAGSFRPPLWRWIYGEPEGLGRLKVNLGDEWKFANPKPGENGGFGVLKTATESGWQRPGTRLKVATPEEWKNS